MSDFYCSECLEPCEAIEETWDAPGTHCNYGRASTFYSGYSVSDCCYADLLFALPDEEE